MRVTGLRVTGRFKVASAAVTEPVFVPANAMIDPTGDALLDENGDPILEMTPTTALLDHNDDPVLDEDWNYVLDHLES